MTAAACYRRNGVAVGEILKHGALAAPLEIIVARGVSAYGIESGMAS